MFWNSVFYAAVITLGANLIIIPQALVFAKLRFRGSNALFFLFILTMMMPFHAELYYENTKKVVMPEDTGVTLTVNEVYIGKGDTVRAGDMAAVLVPRPVRNCSSPARIFGVR